MKNKMTAALMSVLIAVGLWMYVIKVENPNQVSSYYNIPVVLEGESVLSDRGLMLVSDTDLRVQLDLQSNRTNLRNINSDNLTLKADLTGIYNPGEHEVSYTIAFPGNVPPTDVKVVNKVPGNVTIKVAERKRNPEVPVVVEFVGKVKDGFIMDKPKTVLDNETITVEGPAEVVDQIHHAYIQVDCSGRTETISESYRYILQNEQNEPVDAALIRTNVEEIRVEVPIAATKRIPVKVNVNPGGGATLDSTILQLDTEFIDISGSDTALEKINELVVGTINLGDVITNTERTFPISLPEGITNLSGVTEVTVKITFPELSRKELTVTNIQTINVPEGMQAELLTKKLTVTVRGPKEKIQSLQLEHITLQVDLSGVENTAAVEPTVIFAEPYQDLGLVGKYSVSVNVTPAAPAE